MQLLSPCIFRNAPRECLRSLLKLHMCQFMTNDFKTRFSSVAEGFHDSAVPTLPFSLTKQVMRLPNSNFSLKMTYIRICFEVQHAKQKSYTRWTSLKNQTTLPLFLGITRDGLERFVYMREISWRLFELFSPILSSITRRKMSLCNMRKTLLDIRFWKLIPEHIGK